MPPLRRLVLGLNAATVLLVATGLVLLVIPSPMPAGRAPAGIVTSTGTLPDSVRLPVSADLDVADRVVRTNVFSSRRSAPTQRYMVGETAQEPDNSSTEMTIAPPLAGESMDSATASTATDPVPHLYGTMLGPADATALLRLDARMSAPRLYRVGDSAGGYRVAEIADRTVTLMGRSGRIVLRLARPDQ